MIFRIAVIASVGLLSALAIAPAQARITRVDRPATPGCQLGNWTPDGSSGAGFNPGGLTIGADTSSDSIVHIVACASNSNNSLDHTDASSFFVTNDNNGLPYDLNPNESYVATHDVGLLASGGEMYQFVSNNTIGVLASVVVWKLASLGTEIELNNWCTAGTTGAFFTYAGVTYSGGCNSVTQDLVFNSSGQLIEYVKDSVQGTYATVTARTLPLDWTISSASVPEPDTLTLGAVAAAIALVCRQRRRRDSTAIADVNRGPALSGRRAQRRGDFCSTAEAR